MNNYTPKKHTYLVLYTCTKRKLETASWYDTNNDDMYFLHDLTNNEFVRIPWSDPTQRDLKAFTKGYSFAKGKEIEFEKEIKEW